MKILYVTTLSDTMNAFLFPHIEMLIKKGNQVDLACSVSQDIRVEFIELGCKVHNIKFSRNPLSINNFYAYNELKILIKKEKYSLVHTHTPVASFICRIACIRENTVKVLYTAHGFHFFRGAPLLNWIIYYPIEYLLSSITNTIITINKEDFYRAKEYFLSKNTEYLPGVGFDYMYFKATEIDKHQKRSSIGIPTDAFVVLSVGELNRNKNHAAIIKAISLIKDMDIHYVICGDGPLKGKLIEFSKELGLNKNVHFLGYRRDVNEIYKCADIFAFPSKREGLGISALESMASGLPLIASNVHGILDYSENRVTGFNCNPRDYKSFAKAIIWLKQNNAERVEMGILNSKIAKKYNLEDILDQLDDIYSRVIYD